MNNFIFDIMVVIIPLLVLCIIVFTFALMFNPKLRGKFMSNQIKATRHMIDESKDDLQEMGTTISNIAIQIKKYVMDTQENILKDLSTRKANISKENIEIKARALKKGLSSDTIYCKHCGQLIDNDSTFCKHCGKEQ